MASSSKSSPWTSLSVPFSTTFSIGGVSFHPAPTGVRVAHAEGYAASFIPAPDPQLSVIAPVYAVSVAQVCTHDSAFVSSEQKLNLLARFARSFLSVAAEFKRVSIRTLEEPSQLRLGLFTLRRCLYVISLSAR